MPDERLPGGHNRAWLARLCPHSGSRSDAISGRQLSFVRDARLAASWSMHFLQDPIAVRHILAAQWLAQPLGPGPPGGAFAMAT